MKVRTVTSVYLIWISGNVQHVSNIVCNVHHFVMKRVRLTFSYPAELQFKSFVFDFIVHNVDSTEHNELWERLSKSKFTNQSHQVVPLAQTNNPQVWQTVVDIFKFIRQSNC